MEQKYAPAGTQLPPYNPDRRCPKCNHDQVTTTHYAAECTDDGCSTCDREHLRRACQRCKHQWAEAVTDLAAPPKRMVSVADPATEQMRRETGHDCIACPTRVRDLMATAHNLLVRLDANDWSSIPRKRESLRESLAQIQPFSDAHFVALDGWRRPTTARKPTEPDPAGRAAEANQDSDGETTACPCDQFCPDGERCDGLTTQEAVAQLNAEQRADEADDLGQASTKPAEKPCPKCGLISEHTPQECDERAAQFRSAVAGTIRDMSRLSASQSHVVTSGTSGLIIRPGSSHAAA